MGLKFSVHTEGMDAVRRQLALACSEAEHVLAIQVESDTVPDVPARAAHRRAAKAAHPALHLPARWPARYHPPHRVTHPKKFGVPFGSPFDSLFYLRGGGVFGGIKSFPPALPVLRQHPPRKAAPGGQLPRQWNEPAGDLFRDAAFFPRHRIHGGPERKNDIRSFCSHLTPPAPRHAEPVPPQGPRPRCFGAKS